MGSIEQDLAGELVSSVSTFFSVTDSKDVRGGTCRAEMSGGSADAVDARILATFSLKNLPKSSAESFSDVAVRGGCSNSLTVRHSLRGLCLHESIVVVQNAVNLDSYS